MRVYILASLTLLCLARTKECSARRPARNLRMSVVSHCAGVSDQAGICTAHICSILSFWVSLKSQSVFVPHVDPLTPFCRHCGPRPTSPLIRMPLMVFCPQKSPTCNAVQMSLSTCALNIRSSSHRRRDSSHSIRSLYAKGLSAMIAPPHPRPHQA